VVKPVAKTSLEVRGSVDGARLVILIQRRPERSRIGCSSTKLVLVDVGVVKIVVMKVLLLAPDSPRSVSETSEQ